MKALGRAEAEKGKHMEKIEVVIKSKTYEVTPDEGKFGNFMAANRLLRSLNIRDSFYGWQESELTPGKLTALWGHWD